LQKKQRINPNAQSKTLAKKQNPTTHKYSILILWIYCWINEPRHRTFKKIEFDFVQPYDKVALCKGYNATSTAGAVLVLDGQQDGCPVVLRVFNMVRTYYEHGTTL
jgi:hypothetical protein